MTEYGIFNSEGCVERGYWSEEAAQAAADSYDPDDEVYPGELCGEHDEQPYDGCEECNAEDEDEEEDE